MSPQEVASRISVGEFILKKYKCSRDQGCQQGLGATRECCPWPQSYGGPQAVEEVPK